ncbi:hypothetical protein KQI42_19220 [Tissierella sp. MSJ-40]|uniref:Uncharacterized protein n=1 Tax=Tissierella simiarum TaxID=2841534 RepID=A0ABS6EBG2_9FIRM|nr:hypothetical protein [Tissierella simiarum]MBU5440127.1 hypothetical protein [Tissierella simiarum]
MKNELKKATFYPLKIGKNIDDIVDFKDKKEFWLDLDKEASLVFPRKLM